jgi:hypothetical protein
MVAGFNDFCADFFPSSDDAGLGIVGIGFKAKNVFIK